MEECYRFKLVDPTEVFVDAGYKTPAIAKLLLDDGVKLVFPYKRPMTKAGFRYTQMYVKARMRMKVALTFACMNLKKLAKIHQEWALEMA